MNTISISLDVGNDVDSIPITTRTLALSDAVRHALDLVRARHQQLVQKVDRFTQRATRNFMLPRCKQIGDELLRIQALYPKGKPGRGGRTSGFFADVEETTGLSKSQTLAYTQLAKGWFKLQEYLESPPEGAPPIRSLKGALQAIKLMNAPERPALPGSDGAVDVTAEEVQGSDLPGKRTNYAHAARERALPPLLSLKATPVGQRHQARLEAIYQDLIDLLDEMEQEEKGDDQWNEPEQVQLPAEVIAPPPARSWSHPQDADPAPAAAATLAEKGARLASFFGGEVIAVGEASPAPLVEAPAPAPVLEEPIEEAPAAATEGGRKGKAPATLPAMFPVTLEGMEALDKAIDEHGGGPGLAKALGLSTAAISKHRCRSRAKLWLT